MKRRHDPAVITVHCELFGRLMRYAKTYKVTHAASRPHWPTGTTVTFTEPGARSESSVAIVDGDHRFITIEENGRIVFDSRNEGAL